LVSNDDLYVTTFLHLKGRVDGYVIAGRAFALADDSRDGLIGLTFGRAGIARDRYAERVFFY
jgi:hypothetical protein